MNGMIMKISDVGAAGSWRLPNKAVAGKACGKASFLVDRESRMYVRHALTPGSFIPLAHRPSDAAHQLQVPTATISQ
jgi:hypothetical protein